MKKAINDLFTGNDGVTQDPARWLWFVGVVTFLLFSGYSVYMTGKFDMASYGMAYGTLLAAGAAGVRIKQESEPLPKDPAPLIDVYDPSLEPPKRVINSKPTKPTKPPKKVVNTKTP